MNELDQAILSSFKKELGSYNDYVNLLNRLEDKLDEAYYQLSGVKGIRYDVQKGNANKKFIDNKKLELSSKISKLEEDITRLSIQIDYIDNILMQMENVEIRSAIIDCYVNKLGLRAVADEYDCSHTSLMKKMNKEILKTIVKVYQ